MLEFLRSLLRPQSETQDTGTFPDALLNMTELQKNDLAQREDGHQAFMRDYGSTRRIYRRVIGFA